MPSLRAPFGASVVDSCFNEEHRVALKRAGTYPANMHCGCVYSLIQAVRLILDRRAALLRCGTSLLGFQGDQEF